MRRDSLRLFPCIWLILAAGVLHADDSALITGAVDPHIQAQVEAYLKQKDDEKKRDEQVNGYEVGSALGMSARWETDRGLLFETPHKDFVFHLGGRFQQDTVFWNEETSLRRPPAQGGAGTFEDGTFFRRLRLQMDGTMWETMIFNMEYSFENFGNNTGIGTMEECYAGMKELPIFGEIRVGQVRIPQCLDPNFTGSNKAGTFLEPASFGDAFFNNLGVGVWLGNHYLDERATWSAMAYRQEGGSISSGGSLQQGGTNGAAIQNGNFGYTGRITGLPIYENEGRCLLHLGLSGTYRSGLPNSTTGNGPRFVDFSARPEMRDTIGNYNNVGPGNSTRFVSTGPLRAEDASVIDAELLWIQGPFSVIAEWALAYADQAVGQAGTPLAGQSLGNVGFNGGYVQVSYFLTGENRLYEKRHDRLNSLYVRPNTPFFFLRHGDGGFCTGLGAWEIAARYSYLNLNDGDVQGGILESETFGINWFLNPHVRVMFDYLHTQRYDLGQSAAIGGVGTLPGATDSFGIRTQIVF